MRERTTGLPRLIVGDAVEVLGCSFAEAEIDIIYCDPPFGNEQVWSGRAGSFDDRWEWGTASSTGWSALHQHNPAGATLLAATTPTRAAKAYLGVMAGLIIELRRVLKMTGTLWLHFDDTMGPHLRLLCEVVFGVENSLGLVIWKRTSSHANSKGFGRVHDTIACYGRSRVARWRVWRCGGEFSYGDPALPSERNGVDGYADDRLNARASERIGYPTQKPISLIERFIRCGSLPGDLLLDPTCGSGSALVAAVRLGRRSVGIDMSPDAIAAARSRLEPVAHAAAKTVGAA